ncbi:MAG: fibronectin type III domain-containing protein, partial [Melioribacteraceae bacterium]|nr:fibronectin type III domain-containing protein [Melioribacteraceae bacterium]
WENTDDIHPFVQFSSDGKVWKRFEAETSSDGKTNKAVIDQLEPLTRYSYKLTPTLKVIPGQKAKPTEFRLVTPANDQNLLIYNRLPLLFMVYRTISYRDRYPEDQFPQVPWGRTLSDDELEYLRTKATQFNTDFYFRNSSCRVVFDWDFYIIEDTLWLSDVGNEDPYWLSPNQRVTKDFERISEELGKEPTDYAGVICSYAWLNYPDRKTSALRDPSASDGINIRQAYGGAAVGVPAPWKYGETSGYNGNPNPGPHSRQDWLITHEFHHQIDALFNWSGFPEYYHADMPWVMPRRFGEDFDFNAWIIRNQNPEDWLALKFGNLEKTVDADNDGLPDDDPTLPFDEKRLGGDPAKVDTDGDGLTDLEEFMAGNSLSTKLDDPDSDKDGINDKDDPEPLYAIDPEIQKSVNDENLIWNDFGDISGEDYESQLSLAWTESNLYFKSESTKPVNIMLNIDAEGDGWFHGLDNIQIRISNDGTKSEVVEYYLRDCSSWTAPPKDIRDVLSTDNLKYDIEDNDGNIETIIAIPNLPEYGFDLSSGKEFGIRIGLQTSTDRWVWDELFERNYMMLMKLK